MTVTDTLPTSPNPLPTICTQKTKLKVILDMSDTDITMQLTSQVMHTAKFQCVWVKSCVYTGYAWVRDLMHQAPTYYVRSVHLCSD